MLFCTCDIHGKGVGSDPSSLLHFFLPMFGERGRGEKDQSHWRLCVISSRWACLIFVKASSFWRFRMGPRGGMAPGGMSVWIREDGRRASERLESDEVLCSTARNKWASTLADVLVYYPWSLQRSQGFFSTGVIWNFLLLFIYNVMSQTDKLEPSY